MRAQGWPPDVLGQPEVTVTADDTLVGRFTPTEQWAEYDIAVPAEARRGSDLTLILVASDVFTNTSAYNDPRPKGIRIDSIRVRSVGGDPSMPASAPVLWLTVSGLVWFLALAEVSRDRRLPSFLRRSWSAVRRLRWQRRVSGRLYSCRGLSRLALHC